ncbi:Hypothetical protein NTJ_04260 [Nesidiocoris tenuis]|uniref:DUF4773 domain-containing protein n=1 Tax=Nesidiocoris tenuis TaxID=355587 RepID=A0ABN7AGR0_9HEMI|nr:Hypothetical protein NTJ_04260 [Nesidiocoris tenuis]
MMGFEKYNLFFVCLLMSICWHVGSQDAEEITEEYEESPDEPVSSLPVEASSTTKRPKVTVGTTAAPVRKKTPCLCTEGQCKCCTGALLQRFNYTLRNKACVNVNYNPDDFEFHYKLVFNERVLYQNKMSGKSPRPVCLPIRRFFPGNICMKFSNVYMVGRNFHACVELGAVWNEQELFGVGFDCFRIGTNGIALVKPEDGGGLPTQVVEEVLSPEEEDYDDSA